MAGDRSPPRSNSPSVLAQTGLSTPNLIKKQQQLLCDDAALPFLTGGTNPTASDNPKMLKDKHKQSSHHAPPQIQQLPPQSNINPNPHIPTPSASASSIPPHIRHQQQGDTLFVSSNPTIQPPPNFSPMTNVNNLPDIPCFRLPANHPMFTEYFNKQSSPHYPSPDPRNQYPPHQTYHQRQDQLNQAIKDNQLQRQGDEDQKNTATIINAAVNQIRARDKLLADGSNFCKWNRCIRELAY
ncbi:hypothetical protein PCANC_19347, partial [Puccinia coronata f. sp. avenae]